MATKTTAGQIVRSLRASADMTQEDVASVAHTTAAYISRVENGLTRPTPQWVGKVVAAIGARLATQTNTLDKLTA